MSCGHAQRSCFTTEVRPERSPQGGQPGATGAIASRESAPSGNQRTPGASGSYACLAARVQPAHPRPVTAPHLDGGSPPGVTSAGQPPAAPRGAPRRRRGGVPAGQRPDWDRYADEYQATHGEFLGDAGFVWGPEGLTEAELGVLGDVAGRDVLEVGCGAGQCSRWVRARGGRPVGLDLSLRQLQHSRRIDDEHRRRGARPVLGTATELPFADGVLRRGVLAPSGRCSSSPTSTTRSPRRPGCCDRAGASPSPITHPTRWMFPDDPGEAGWSRASPTGTARRTSRSTTRPARWPTSSTTAPSATGCACWRRHGFRASTDLLEPEWPARPRPGLGRLVRRPRPVHPGYGDLRARRLTAPGGCHGLSRESGVGALRGVRRAPWSPSFERPRAVRIRPTTQERDADDEADQRDGVADQVELVGAVLGVVEALSATSSSVKARSRLMKLSPASWSAHVVALVDDRPVTGSTQMLVSLL